MLNKRKHKSFQKGRKRVLKQHEVIPKNQMKMPEKNIPVPIRPGLTVYISDPSKIEETRIKYHLK